MNNAEKPKRKQVEVTLAKPHEHAGQKRKPGEKIMVTETQRDWLKQRGIIN